MIHHQEYKMNLSKIDGQILETYNKTVVVKITKGTDEYGLTEAYYNLEAAEEWKNHLYCICQEFFLLDTTEDETILDLYIKFRNADPSIPTTKVCLAILDSIRHHLSLVIGDEAMFYCHDFIWSNIDNKLILFSAVALNAGFTEQEQEDIAQDIKENEAVRAHFEGSRDIR